MLRMSAYAALSAVSALLVTGTAAQAQSISSADFCDGSTRDVDGALISVSQGDVFTYVDGIIAIFKNGSFAYDLDALGSVTVLASEDGELFEFRTDGPANIRCTHSPSASGAPGAPVTNAAQASITVQAGVTQTAISTNIAGRFGGAGFAAAPSSIFVSSRGLDTAIAQLGEPELNAWVALDARRFSGASTGGSRNVTVGFDYLVNPDFVIGGFAGVNDQTVTKDAITTETLAPLYGLYAAHRHRENLFVSGYFGFGQPKYTTGATTFTAQRRVLGLSVIGQYQTEKVLLVPTATI